MKQAMIFAAGLGTRLKPLTDTMPKALIPVNGQPLLWHVVQKLKAAGFERLVVNVHHFAEQIVNYLQANQLFGLDIRISDERDMLLETGGGIRKALPLFDQHSPVLIHNVDILSNVDFGLLDTALVSAPDALLLVSNRTTKRYLQFDGDNLRLVGWKNVTTGEVKGSEGRPLAFSGIHVIAPSLMARLAAWPLRFPIMDFYLSECTDARIVGVEQPGLRLLDVGKLDTLEEANEFVKHI